MAFLAKPGIFALLSNRFRLNDVTLSMSSFLVVGMLSIFDTARMTDLGSNIEYRILKSLKMSSNELIHQAGS